MREKERERERERESVCVCVCKRPISLETKRYHSNSERKSTS